MSLKVQNDPANGVGAAPANRIEPPASAVSLSGKARISSGPEGEDLVQVSSVAESIGGVNSALNLQQANRVSQLSALYAGGQYTVDSARVSAALVANGTKETPAGKAYA